MAWNGEIATDAFVRGHPELHHYTSVAGLEGIVRTGTLWATYFEDLNDSSEVVHLQTPLTSAMELRYRQGLIRWRGDSLERRRYVDQAGGVVRCARGLAEDLVGSLYRVGFTNSDASPLAPPFIASFCSHAGDKAYERKNGLLSQWRGYGASDGVCLVFDTAGLVDLLTKDLNANYWVHMSLAAAEYATDDRTIEDLFPDLIDECAAIMDGVFERGQLDEVSEGLFLAFLAGATRYKHRAFAEEREVRFVGVPGTERAVANMQVVSPEFAAAPLKPILVQDRGGRPARRVVLFAGLGETLPLRRVIISPSGRQQELLQRVSEVLPETVPVHLSATPLV